MPTGSSLRRTDIGTVATLVARRPEKLDAFLSADFPISKFWSRKSTGCRSDDLALVAAVGIDAEGGTPSR